MNLTVKQCPQHGSYAAPRCPRCEDGEYCECGKPKVKHHRNKFGELRCYIVGMEVFKPKSLPIIDAPKPPEVDAEPDNAFTGPEKLLHRDFESDMNRRGVHIVHARTDRESTIASGLPDFHCMYRGQDGIVRGCAVEFKKAAGKPSDKQREVIADMRAKGIPVLVAWTLADAILFVREKLLC